MKKQLPSRPNLEQLKKQAKAILKGHQHGDPDVLRRIREHHPRWQNASHAATAKARLKLADAQLIVAREYGFETWAKLKARALPHEVVPVSDAAVTSLREAAGQGDLARINALLDSQPDLINEPGGPGVRTALHDAAGNGKEAAVQLLLERGASPNIRCEGDYAFPLHFAAEKQLFPIIRLLIEHGADPVGEGDYHELGVIGWATAWEYVTASREIVDYLIAHGARHNISSAVSMGEIKVIRELAARSPADLEKRMDMVNKRRRPLHLAVVKKQPEALTALLDLGANMESLDEAGFTALDQAALSGETAMAEILLDRGAKIRLPAAIALQRTRDIENLLRKEPNCLKPGHRWGNLIVRASEMSSGSVVEALLQTGASVNVRDDPKTAVDSTSGYTPLHAAAFRGNLSVVSVLLQHGADVTIRDEKYHGTPAGWADYAGHAEVRDLILHGPVDIMEAVHGGLQQRVEVILRDDTGALERPFREYALRPFNVEDWYTPLVLAVVRGHADLVRLLLDHGADRSVRSPEGVALNEIARQKGHEKIVEMLKEPRFRTGP